MIELTPRAVINKHTLEVSSTSSSHSCTVDPMRMRRNHLEEEMKSRAERFKEEPLADIFRAVAGLDPEAAEQIDWPRIQGSMSKRRQRKK